VKPLFLPVKPITSKARAIPAWLSGAWQRRRRGMRRKRPYRRVKGRRWGIGMGSFVNCRRRLLVSRRCASPGLHTPVPGVSSKAVMPPDNTAQIIEKGMKQEPAPVVFPHRTRAQNRPARAFSFLRDARPYAAAFSAAQRVSSGRSKTNKAKGVMKNAGKH